MTSLELTPAEGGGRFPGFDVLDQRSHWDAATAAVVDARLGMLPEIRFFTVAEEAAATAIFDQLLYQRAAPKVPVTRLVDMRLAEGQTDGWHYDSMPPDDVAWQRSLAGIDSDAVDRFGAPIADCAWGAQKGLLAAVHDSREKLWHGMLPAQVWSLWTRYACTAFYAHPAAWSEIGFAGPAYPRGYKNLGVDKREPFEVADAHPADDPMSRDRS